MISFLTACSLLAGSVSMTAFAEETDEYVVSEVGLEETQLTEEASVLDEVLEEVPGEAGFDDEISEEEPCSEVIEEEEVSEEDLCEEVCAEELPVEAEEEEILDEIILEEIADNSVLLSGTESEIESMIKEKVSLDIDYDVEDYFKYTAESELDDSLLQAVDRNRDKFSGISLILYDCLKSMVMQAVNGEISETYIKIDYCKALGISDIATEDLGYPEVTDENQQAILAAWYDSVKDSLQTQNLANAIKRDCPYEMFWADSFFTNASVSFSNVDGVDYIHPYLIAGYEVNYDYDGDKEDKNHVTLNKEKVAAATESARNAAVIVSANSEKSDLEKLHAYMEMICDLVDYNENTETTHPGDIYGDPWQLIWVFDDDPETEVVCEGYSKAFAYLCELTQFNGNIYCYTTSGKMDTESHMWNTIRMDDGRNYLADITNCDLDPICKDLFLAVPKSGSVDDGYVFARTSNDNTSEFTYTYADYIKNLYTTKELTYSETAYGEGEAVVDAVESVQIISIHGEPAASFNINKGSRVAFTAKVSPIDVSPSDKAVTWTSSNAEVLTITEGGIAEGISAGTAVITCTSVNNPEAYAECTITVLPVPESVSINKTELTLYLNDSEQLTASVSPETVSQRIVWETKDDSIAAVSEDGTVTAVAAGETIIYASSFEDTDIYASCNVTVLLPKAESVAMSKTELTMKVDGSEQLSAAVLPEAADQNVAWQSSNQEVATVSEDGTVEAVAAGTCNIFAVALDGTEIYGTCKVTIIPYAANIFLNHEEVHLNENDCIKLAADFEPVECDQTVTWTSSNPEVAEVTEKGIVRAISVGEAEVICEAQDGSGITASCHVIVDMPGIPIKKSFIVNGISDVDYTGLAHTFDLEIQYGNVMLNPGTDYTVKYKNNTNVGTGSVVITGKGNYKNTVTETFTISPLDISELPVENITLAANGKRQVGQPAVICEVNGVGRLLKSGSEYTVITDPASAYTEPGEYEIRIKGCGNFTGETSFTETIKAKDETVPITKAVISSPKSKAATGEKVELKEDELILSYNGEALVKDTDYKVDYYNNVKPGKASAVITGLDKFSGTKTIIFTISALSMKKAAAELQKAEVVYNGQEVIQEGYTVSYQGEALEEGTDYTVSYLNNNKNGTAGICFNGMGRFTGTLKKTFKILPKQIEDENVSCVLISENGREDSVYHYTKGGVKPAVEVVLTNESGDYVLKEGTDYTVKYQNTAVVNENPEENKHPAAIITGKGKYKGSIKCKYTVIGSSLTKVNLSVSDVLWKNKAGSCKTKVVVTDTNGKILKAGTDYKKDLVYAYVDDTTVKLTDGTEVLRKRGELVDLKRDIIPALSWIRVYVEGTGNYDTSVSAIFMIMKYDIAKAKVKIDDQYFTGSEVKPGKDAVHVTINNQEITDYDIIGYTNNIKKGTAKLTIKGSDGSEYGGLKTVSFKILPRAVEKGIIY